MRKAKSAMLVVALFCCCGSIRAYDRFYENHLGGNDSNVISSPHDHEKYWRNGQHRRHRKDYRRLKKMEGAVKLVGGERSGYEGKVCDFFQK